MAQKKPAGTVVGQRYKIEKFLGEGAMGVVYLSLDMRLDRSIALKLIDLGTGPERDETEKRVLREAQTPARMNHPGIVTVYDYGVEENYAYIAMELVEGKTLWDIFAAKGRIPLGKLVEINSKVCDALKVAHDLNFVHRDIKPANIMILRSGIVKVMDFGLAKGTTSAQDVGLTKTGMLIGTPKYMAPEQIRGGNLSNRTDIYAMGVMMYELLTGQPPHPCDNVYTLLTAVLNEEPPPASAKFDKVPQAIDRILAKCMSKKPEGRYERIELFAKDMEEAIERLRSSASVPKVGDSSGVRDQGGNKGDQLPDYDSSKLPGLDVLDGAASMRAPMPGKQGVSQVVPNVAATAVIKDKWEAQRQVEVANQKQDRANRCKYRMQGANAVETQCSEMIFPKSTKGFCFLHDPDLDKSQANIRRNIEDRVRAKNNLEGTVFRNCQLNEAQLAGARLEYADWSKSDLRDANLWEGQLCFGMFQNTNFDKANLGAADLHNGNFPGASFRATKFKNANLQNASFEGANFSSANCKETDFKGASLKNCDFNRTDLSSAILDKSDCTGADFRGADLTNASLVGTNLNGTKLRGALIARTNLREANLKGASLERGDLSGAKLREANLQEANFVSCKLEKAELWGADLRKANLNSANLVGADLGKANLEGANLTGANLKGANLRGAKLDGANLTKAQLQEADLIEASLMGTDFTGAELGGADFTGAKIDIAKFPIKLVPSWSQAIWDQVLKRQLEVKSWGFD